MILYFHTIGYQMDTFDDRMDWWIPVSTDLAGPYADFVWRTRCLNRRRIFFVVVIPMMRNIYCTRSCRLKLPAFLHAIQEFVTALCLRPWLRKNKSCCEKTSAWLDLKTFGNMAGNMVEFRSEMFQTLPPGKLRYPMKIVGWKMRDPF